jgi:tetratricopeptide (TPR) repeat protein
LDEAVDVARRNGHFVVLVGALGAFGSAALSVGEYDDAERLLVECLSVGSDVGHRIWTANALQLLAVLAMRRGRSTEAHDLAQQAYDAARSSASPPVMMGAEATLGLWALSMGDAVAAVRHCEEAIGFASQIGAPSFTAAHLVTLAEARLALGDLTAAREAVEAGRELAHVGRPLTQAQLLNMQGRVARAERDIGAAEQFLHVALELFEDVGDRQGRADTFEDLAGVSVDRHEFEYAADLFGAADALREQLGYVRSPHRQAVRNADVERVVSALGARRFEELSSRPSGTGSNATSPQLQRSSSPPA